MEDGRKLDVGHVLALPDGEMEVTGVSYQETEETGRHHFAYTLRDKSEVDAEREAEKAHQGALAATEEAAGEETQPEITDTVG